MSKQSFGHPNPLEDARRVQTLGALPTNNNGSGAPADASYVTISSETGLSNERALDVDSPLTLEDGGSNSTVTLGLDYDALEETLDDTYLRLDTTNDPLTGPLDIVTDDEHALRVLTEGIASTDPLAKEVWLVDKPETTGSSVAIRYAALDLTGATKPTLTDVAALPSGLTTIEYFAVTLDGTAIYIVASVAGKRGLWYCANPKAGSPIWAKLYEVGDSFHSDVIDDVGSFYSLTPHGSTVSTIVRHEDYGNYFYLLEFTGAVCVETLLPLNGADQYSGSSYRAYTNNTLGLQSSAGGVIGAFQSNDGRSSSPWVNLIGGHYYAVYYDAAVGTTVNLYDINTGAKLLSNVGDTFGYYRVYYPRGAYYGTEIDLVNDAGELWTASDGATFTKKATSAAWATGCVEQCTAKGGGALLWIKKNATASANMLQISTDGGTNWIDMTGNFWSLASGNRVILNMQVTFDATEIAGINPTPPTEVFNVDSIDAITTVTGTLEVVGSETITGQIVSSLATGTSPLDVDSTTLNTNLNADLLDGQHAAAFAPAASAHNPVTLSTEANMVLALSTQQIGLDTQAANKVFAGPTTGADAAPTFRSLVAGDIPAAAPAAHQLDGALHTVSELTAGHVLTALSATTFGFALPREILMADGITPPDPLTTEDGTDWLYSD